MLFFSDMLSNLMENVEPHHRVRLSISSSSLRNEIWVPFMSPDHLTADRILVEVERVLQSQKEWLLHDSIQVNFVHAIIPVGRGRGKHFGNLEEYLRKKQCFVRIPKDDNNCCARALITARAIVDNDPHKKTILNGRPMQGHLAKTLMREAQIPEGQSCGIDEFRRFQKVLPGYDVVIISREFMNSIIFRGDINAEKQLVLYHADNHFSVITKMTSFLGKSYFCKSCFVGYQHPSSHSCKTQCVNCKSATSCLKRENKICQDCNRFFVSELCLQNHYKNGICNYVKLCKDCGKTFHTYRSHKCGFIVCKVCKKQVPKDHKCYIHPIKEKEKDEKGYFIFYDFESMLDEENKHVPNLCVSHKVCSECIELPMQDLCDCGRERKIFKVKDTLKLFGDYLWNGQNKKALCIAHNSQGYDLHFIMGYIHTMGKKPDVIQNGQKLMYMECQGIKFIDSLNFLPMSLAKLPKAFGIKELKKGFFPHLFNVEENQAYKGPMPDIKYYDPDAMSSEMRAEFLQWYETQTNFDFEKDILAYCISDVDILQRCCSKFRKLFMTHAEGIDPFQGSITIASACNRVYRQLFLDEDEIAIIPALGYYPGKQSAIAGCWMEYISQTEGIHIQHAFNGGEARVLGRMVDGLCGNTIYQFHGCFWHGCISCYKNRATVNPVNECTMDELWQKTVAFTSELERKGFKVIEKWECQLRDEMKDNEILAELYDRYKPYEPLKPRDAFFGGRTNATKLFHTCSESDEQIRYVDFTSLYPYVNKYAKLPVGHPEIFRGDQIPEHIEGLLKCKVLPPSHLLHPVLPYRARNKLLFPLCRTCAENNIQDFCSHGSDEDRALTGTWVTAELDKAISLGYKILDKYEAWHFASTKQYDTESKSGGIWASYINLWLKEKQQASGWPSWCKTEEEKKQYMDDYMENEGVELEEDKIEKNEGLSSLAKLMLNSFWGKFGQNPQKDKTVYIENPSEYIRMMTDDKIEVCDLNFVNDEILMMRWREKEIFVETLPNTNVILAAYTTAYACLHLYNLLSHLQHRVLYFDTDSVVYIHKVDQWNPPLGDYLGQLKDETNGVPIATFVSGGAKNYAYQLQDDSTVCKIRGFTLNHRNSKKP